MSADIEILQAVYALTRKQQLLRQRMHVLINIFVSLVNMN